MARYQDCDFCGEEIDTADRNYLWPHHGGQSITECVGCHRKFDVYPDADWDDGGWHDRTVIRPLLALPGGAL